LQRWGLDLLVPLPPAQGNLKYVVVAVEYFSKWIEAKPLATITSVTFQKFFWQNIVCRFGVPKAITVDNGTQFDAEAFKEFYEQIGTKIHFASVRHPKSNGLVERANDIITTRIMKLIFNQPRGKWPDELIKVVWSHNITISRSTGFTPLKLLFGDEAITPEEAKAGSIRTVASVEDEADYSVAKDAIEGIRLQAVENINKYQAETIKWRDRKVRLKNIKPGHLVLQRVTNPDTVGKLQLKWEGPFLVVSSSRPSSYRLKDMDGNDIPRSWNADELRRYYVELDVFLFFPMAPFSFLKGEERFLMGPYHVISLFLISALQEQYPQKCKCKSWACTIECKEKRKNKEKLERRP
jgi:hypothetical protein